MEINKIIDELIDTYGFKQADIARHANTSQASISRIQKSNQDPSHSIAKNIIELHERAKEQAA